MTLELTPETLADYLVQAGRIAQSAGVVVTPLAWGVSNLVLRVDRPDGPSLVVKQSQPRLRTRIDWFSRCERIYREADVLRTLTPLLPPGMVPHVLFEDRTHYVLGLEAIRADHVVWKPTLLAGEVSCDVAATLGKTLGTIHRETAGNPACLPDAADWSLFDELRIDPFYRWIARVHPALAPAIDRLIADMGRHRVCLVHADFSPKNVLIHPDGVSLVDFETGHYGDPAFDLGFFLSHLLLKSLRWPDRLTAWQSLIAAFREQYRQTVDGGPVSAVNSTATTARGVQHLAACTLARIDGKSPVDYLTKPWQSEFVREITIRWLLAPLPTLEHAVDDFFTRVALKSEDSV